MQSQREQPFFKPLSNRDGNQHFELSQSSSLTRNRHGQASRTNEHQTTQEVGVNGERLSSLHAKLHLEADKIRKWKNQTEFDIKQKDQKIHEAVHTIESLRKSLLELQLQNESLSLKLQEEMSCREEILQSVAATRNLCSILKDHCCKTDSKLQSCESEKTQLKYQEKEHQQQFEELSVKFNDLELAKKEDHNRLTNELTLLSKEKDNIETELKVQREQAEKKLKTLVEKCDEKDIEIRNIHVELERNNEKVHVLQTTLDQLQNQLSESKQEYSKTQEKHEGLRKDLIDVQESKASIEVQLKEKVSELENANKAISDIQTELKSSNEEHGKEIFLLQKAVEEHKLEVAKNKNRLRFMEVDLEKANSLLEEVKSSKDMLIMEKTELENRISELEKRNAELIAQHEENCLVLNQMNANVCDLQGQLASSQQDSSSLLLQLNDLRTHVTNVETEKVQLDEIIKTFDADITSKKADITDLQKEFQDRCEQIVCLTAQLCQADENLKQEINKHEAVVTELKNTQIQCNDLKKQGTNREKEIKKLQKELENITGKNSDLNKRLEDSVVAQDKLREEIDELKCELQQVQETNESLLDEKQCNDQALQGQLEHTAKAATDLETKNKTLKSDVTAHKKQIKELEKEIKSLKTKVTHNTKAIDGKDEEIRQLQSCLEEKGSENESLEEQLQELNKVVEEEKARAKEAVKKAEEMRKLSESSLKEKDTMKKHCEKEKSQMSSIMQSYKTESDNIVERKDKEIESLKQKMKKENDKSKNEADKHIAELQKEIEMLRKTVSESGYQMETLQKNCGDKENLVMELEKQNTKKVEEVKELQQQLEKLYIKNTTTSVVQTSPFPDRHYQKPSSRIPTPKVIPQTPKGRVHALEDITNTPSVLKTPSNHKTPSDMKTPQRSILKSLPTNSASKKRRVIFAPKEEDEELLLNESDPDSPAFDVMDIEENLENRVNCRTPLLLKPSPKLKTPDSNLHDKQKSAQSSSLPLHRTPRGPPVDLAKKKHDKVDKHRCENVVEKKSKEDQIKKEKASSVRKAPSKTPGKFFKQSPKNKMSKLKEREDSSWMESDDIFGFACED